MRNQLTKATLTLLLALAMIAPAMADDETAPATDAPVIRKSTVIRTGPLPGTEIDAEKRQEIHEALVRQLKDGRWQTLTPDQIEALHREIQVLAAPGVVLQGDHTTNGKLVVARATQVKRHKATFLGVHVRQADPTLRKHLGLPAGVGLVIDYISADSPAAKAGLKPHDVLCKIGEQILVNLEQLTVLVRMHKPDQEVKLTVFRDGVKKQATVKLKQREVAVYAQPVLPGHAQPGQWRASGLTAPLSIPLKLHHGAGQSGPVEMEIEIEEQPDGGTKIIRLHKAEPKAPVAPKPAEDDDQ